MPLDRRLLRYVRRHHRVGPVQLLGRPEPRAVEIEGGQELCGCEVRREGVREPKHAGELSAEEAGAENPQRHVRPRSRNRVDGLRWPRFAEQRLELEDVLREGVGTGGRTPQCEKGALVGARGSAEPEVDPAGIQGGERAELLGDHERRMVGQHDPTRADPDRRRPRGHVRDHDRRCGARDTRHVVVLREPVAVVSPAFSVTSKVEGILQRIGRGAALDDRREVEDRDRKHRPTLPRLWRPTACDARALPRRRR